MKVIIQRVKDARVEIEGVTHNEIQKGFMLLVGLEENDGQKDLEKAADKIAKMRIFEDDDEKMNLNIQQVGGEILSISQFTLAADCRKGNRPSFTDAMDAETARSLFNDFNEYLRREGLLVKEGIFQEHMNIILNNDGPVTIILQIKDGKVI